MIVRLRLVCALGVLLMVSALLAPAYAQPPRPMMVQLLPERTLTAHGTFIGLGAQDDSNLLWSGPNRAAGAQVPADFTQIVAPRLRALRMPVVRKFIDVAWFAPTPNGYTWDSLPMQGLYANLAEHQANGTQVMLTIWTLPPWLVGDATTRRDSELRPAGSFPSPAQEAAWVRVLIDLLQQLDQRGFDQIRYLGAPNELEDIDPARLVRPFTLLRRELAAAGLAERISIFGPDAFVEEVPLARRTPGLDPLLDLYDFHYYTGEPFESGLISAIDRLVREVAPTGKQLWLTEFGEVTRQNDDWRALVLGAIAAINGGLNAALMWNVQDQIYNTANQPSWGLWDVYTNNYALKPAFDAWQIMAGHLPPNAAVYDHTCARAQCADLRLAALGDANGHRALMLFNTGATALPIALDLGRAAPTLPLYRYLLDPAAPFAPQRDGLLRPYDQVMALDGNILRDTLPPGALAVYSTYRPVHPPSRATNRPISATSSEGSAFSADRAVDNDPFTRWSSAFSDDQALTLDLGRPQAISALAISWEAAYAHRYRVVVSLDGQRWQPIVVNDTGMGGNALHEFAPTMARYVRIVCVERATPFGFSIWEVSVW